MTDVAFHNVIRVSPRLRRPLICVGVLSLAVFADFLAQSFAHFSSLGLFLLPAIAIIGILTGMSYALAAAGASIIFVAVVCANHAIIFQPPWDALVRLSVFSVAAPVIAMVVGYQHRRTEALTDNRVNAALRAKAADLASLASALKISNDELDQFAYVTSHDLKAPLRGIHNLSQWIEEDLGDRLTPEAHVQFDLLRGRVQRMESLINGLLEYAQVGRGHGKLERVDVADLLTEVVDWIGPPPEVQVRIGANMPTIKTDKLRLHQVFSNLLENAVKHRGRPDGIITVTCEPIGRFYRFGVSDNGQGIEPKYHQRIFGIFQTLIRRDELEGTGIGLALVKKVVEAKGGKVTVESVPGQGATFCFTWPMAEDVLP